MHFNIMHFTALYKLLLNIRQLPHDKLCQDIYTSLIAIVVFYWN